MGKSRLDGKQYLKKEMLKLERPLVFLDIEATGIDRENDRIVELSVCKLSPNMTRETKTMRFNPEIPIPAEATAVHGICDGDVAGLVKFRQVAKSLLEFLTGSDLAGFNSNAYDIPMLFFEFQRAGIEFPYWDFKMVDVGNIFKINEPRTLEAAVRFYLGLPHEGAHGAEADTLATVDVFLAQVEKYQEMPKTMDELHLYSNYGRKMLDLSGKFVEGEDGVILFNFGKHRGCPAKDHPGFLEWMLYKADFSSDTTRIAQQIYQEVIGG